mmetsp:Transcript_35138/g.76930  ORF Transcript_35138/g.76930 Transcript_35138/m.76930 type:complete len:91 (-) Transcript_35138:125-397(-)
MRIPVGPEYEINVDLILVAAFNLLQHLKILQVPVGPEIIGGASQIARSFFRDAMGSSFAGPREERGGCKQYRAVRVVELHVVIAVILISI